MDAAQFKQVELIVRAAVLEANQTLTAQVIEIRSRLEDGDERMGRIERDVKAGADSSSEMRDMFDTAKKGLALMGSLGNGLKWLVGIAAPLAGLWAFMHGKDKP